jgi:hypothetical protein
MPKYSASEMPTTKSGTWLRTWPISRSCTTTHDGRNKTPYGPLPVPMLFAALSHASSTMPRQPRTSHGPCSMLALMISRMGGSMALNSTTNVANGARGTGTPRDTACASTNVCSVMGQGIRNSYATSLTKDAEWEEYAASPTTT